MYVSNIYIDSITLWFGYVLYHFKNSVRIFYISNHIKQLGFLQSGSNLSSGFMPYSFSYLYIYANFFQPILLNQSDISYTILQ